MECTDKMILGGALFIVLLHLIGFYNVFGNIIISIVVVILLWIASWTLSIVLTDESEMGECGFEYWGLGLIIGLGIVMMLCFILGGGNCG